MNRTLMIRTALVLLTLIPVACSSPKERARQKLGEMNISYDQNTFIERAKAGDGIVVAQIAAAKGRSNVVKLLVEKGADLKATDREGNTSLMWAAKGGNSETIKLLVEKGANVNATNSAGLSALSIARTGNRADIQELLVKA